MDGKKSSLLGSDNNSRNVNIQLEEQDHKFALNEHQPVRGELRISEGVLSFKGSNLKPGRNGYKFILIGRKNGSTVNKIMGDIIPDIQGTATLQHKINPLDIDGEGTELSCFYVFMVADMGRPMRPVLQGDLIKQRRFAGENGDWSTRIFNSYYNEYILAKIAALETTALDFTRITPFDDVWFTDNWRYVTDQIKLPVASIGAESQIRKYGHFIFGYAGDSLYLAVPGRHSEEEWPDRGRSGFMMWQSISGSDEYGYWVMVIDRKTGEIRTMS